MFYLYFANGTEEVEAIAALDVMRRAGLDVKTVGVGSKTVVGSHGVTVTCDLAENDAVAFDGLEGIVLPGGMPGTLNLEGSDAVQKAIRYCDDNDKLLCAICAAPSVLGHAGVLQGKKAVCFPGFEKELTGALHYDGYVCRDGNVVTGKGMGCAVLFGLAIVEAVKGKAVADDLKKTLQCAI